MNAHLKLALLLVLVIAYFVTGHFAEVSHSHWKKISPFTDVTFEDETIFVEFEARNYELVSIADVNSMELVSTARKRFGQQWQKRIREDIAEVLSAAGVSVEPFVDLKLKDRETNTIREIFDAEMTKANRSLIYDRS